MCRLCDKLCAAFCARPSCLRGGSRMLSLPESQQVIRYFTLAAFLFFCQFRDGFLRFGLHTERHGRAVLCRSSRSIIHAGKASFKISGVCRVYVVGEVLPCFFFSFGRADAIFEQRRLEHVQIVFHLANSSLKDCSFIHCLHRIYRPMDFKTRLT